MTGRDEQPPAEPPVAGDETATLLGSLERQRAIIAWKCGGLDAAGLRATLAPSTMTLGGLVKHLAAVEDEYFTVRLLGRGPVYPAEGGQLGGEAHPQAEVGPFRPRRP